MSLDLLIRNVALPDGSRSDIAIDKGIIVEVAPAIAAEAGRVIEGEGYLATPPFVDSHFHMDSTLSLGMPRLNQSGTLLEGIALWGELKPHLTVAAIKARALDFCKLAIARGTLAIRSHVDICDDRLLAVDALLEVRAEMRPYIDLQLVAFPQDGYLRYGRSAENLARALNRGVDVVGGIPHFERTMADGAASVRTLCEIAAKRGLLVDMHCDESDDPLSRHVESLTCETTRLGLQGRVTGSHLTSMHSMDNYYVSKLIGLMREADLHVVANPLINITLQGRHDTYPKRRGMTRVKELLAAGLNVACGHDCVMDPWYPLGSHDMLEVASMGLHVGQMTGVAEMAAMFQSVTSHGAKVLHLDGYGIAKGARGDVVILQARNPIEALRLKPARLYVIRGGTVIAETPKVEALLHLGAGAQAFDFTR
ncbi:amidohydrolase family protein [Zavarzinia compransoris]|uniref:Cytosine deaminase n=1 Tax=Zavarzinia compransoris TaxID=1264899 RepID=A0A317DZ02_9PROT|nr:amidohydrolase family protein [Zavarzinia compransoris]PWR19631.1 cytosine deaminase [Zavarzinia compransoris]TDP43428.1 cytosine deaminase [Zavarzinia compransoris]